MTIELTLLGCTLILAIVQIMLASTARTRETGTAYNAGPRDQPGPPEGILAGRLRRAQENLLQTLPLFIAAVLMLTLLQHERPMSLYGACIYFAARVLYIPLYAMGIPMWRSLVWVASMVGLLMVLAAAMLPA
ncbi:MAG: MAPEG family protein [Janthinobacterium lividum]